MLSKKAQTLALVEFLFRLGLSKGLLYTVLPNNILTKEINLEDSSSGAPPPQTFTYRILVPNVTVNATMLHSEINSGI